MRQSADLNSQGQNMIDRCVDFLQDILILGTLRFSSLPLQIFADKFRKNKAFWYATLPTQKTLKAIFRIDPMEREAKKHLDALPKSAFVCSLPFRILYHFDTHSQSKFQRLTGGIKFAHFT
jgi:hypothetical protein